MSNDHSSPVQEGQEETGATLSTQERISPIIFTITILRLGHSLRDESICVLNSVEQRVKVGDMVVILVEHFHVIKAIIPLTFIEVQIGNSLVGEGIERFE